MPPSDESDDWNPEVQYLICASCGSKARTSWSFCRNCESSLDEATPMEERSLVTETEDIQGVHETGCLKCGHEHAEVDTVATTGTGLSRMFDLQTNQFRVVTCTNCGYSEFYRGQDLDAVLDLFLG